ncbi:membrane-anchored junction protein isoform X2 [Vombatus ursinus]|uniref:membrane-anchored junction protein isoform X2 n=1 Tax=Vombatus ursinus TaxID=29139 RepID=UPI000FFCE180|nr:membrane-anchored junction protein isoform X2 [Vombatus ursinus]
MSLQAFTYPLPETRFLHAGTSLYKFKIRYGSSVRGEEIADKKVVSQELEDSIRAVLGNLDNLQPFTTDHFIIFPYKSKWERVSHLRFKHGAAFLEPYPFVCTLYVEMKWAPAGTSGGDNDFPEMPDAPSADCPPALGQGESQGSGSYLKGHNEEAEVRTVAAKRRRLEGGKFPPGREQGRTGLENLPQKRKRLRTLTLLSSRNVVPWQGRGLAWETPRDTLHRRAACLLPRGPPSQNLLDFGAF